MRTSAVPDTSSRLAAVPFPGFAAGPAGAGPNGTVGAAASGAAGAGAGAGGYPHRISRMVDEGKVRQTLVLDPVMWT